MSNYYLINLQKEKHKIKYIEWMIRHKGKKYDNAKCTLICNFCALVNLNSLNVGSDCIDLSVKLLKTTSL